MRGRLLAADSGYQLEITVRGDRYRRLLMEYLLDEVQVLVKSRFPTDL